MKRTNLLLTVLIALYIVGWSQPGKSELLELTGPYLGQEPLGLIPELFAPGFISTGLSEAVCNFTPDGQEVYFNVAYSVGKDAKSCIAFSKIVDGIWILLSS